MRVLLGLLVLCVLALGASALSASSPILGLKTGSAADFMAPKCPHQAPAGWKKAFSRGERVGVNERARATTTTKSAATTQAKKSDSSASGALEISEGSFSEILGGNDEYFVDFYAPWCGHCLRLAPELDSLASKVPALAEGKERRSIIVAKIDGPSNPKADSRFGISGYPTLYLFKGGNMYEYTGSRNADAMFRWLKFGWKRSKGIAIP